MGITLEALTEFYPNLYHMAEASSWPSIQRHGLLSTTALLDLFEINGTERTKIESSHRPRSVAIEHTLHGKAVIRDQIPMHESALQKCLEGMTPKEWYEYLNGRVFFWATKRRVETLLGARAYRAREHLVITVNAKTLLERYGDKIRLSPINSGSTVYRAVARGRETFRSLHEYPFEARKRLRGVANAVAEVAFEYSIPDLTEFAVRVERRRRSKVLEVLYRQ